MSSSEPIIDLSLEIEGCRYLVFQLNNHIKLYKTVSAYFMAICLIDQLKRFRYESVNKSGQDDIL